MRLQDNAIKTVAYVGVGDPADADSFDPAGTCFFVSLSNNKYYLVTADHVAKVLGDGGFCIRLNREKDGLGQCHLVERARWIRHPVNAASVDLAVLEFEPPTWCDIGVFPRRAFLSDFKMGSKRIGPGDLAYVVGLFEPIYG